MSRKINIEADSLKKIYKNREVVKSVSLSMEKGEVVGLLGPNGAGKTTTFYMITGIVRPNHGRVMYNGEEITNLPMYKRARLGLGYLPQEASVFRNLTVEENIVSVLEIRGVNKKERIAQILTMQGNKQIELDELCAGDIGATTKLQFTQTGDTLCDKNFPVVFNKIRFPKPNIYSGVLPADKNDDEKLSTAIQRVMEEDPTFVMSRNYETKQLLIGGQGEKHLYIILCKIKNKFGVHAELQDVVVSYRETILGKAEVEGKHKKQSGGAGQYGDVFIRFEHSDKDFEFVDEIKGGVVPRNYIPAVEKGLIEAKEKGVLAGYPVINFKATLYDGSYHPVDSNDLSFKLAAILAFKAGMEKAKPVLLEPFVRMEIRIPEEYMGDVMGDLNKRRGRVLGMDHTETGEQLLLAEVPEAEILKYSIDLRALTQGRGEFEYEFVRYEEVPENISKRIIEEKNKDK